MKTRIEPCTLASLGLTALFWGSSFVGIRASLLEYSPGHLVLLRFLVASVVLGICALIIRMPLPKLKDIPKILLLGGGGITISHVALVHGQVTVTAGAASLLNACTPIFTALLANVFLGERLGAWGWLGITTSFGGVALIAFGEGKGVSFNPNALLILLAAFSLSLYFVFQKPFLQRYSVFNLTTYTVWTGTFFMLVFYPGLGEAIQSASLKATLAVLYLGIFPGALAYLTWTYATSKIPASIAACCIYASPVLANIIAWIWLKEVPTILSLLGGFFALLGVTIVSIWGRRG
jgi:drug/metabolite transporter (DMT)-like permease